MNLAFQGTRPHRSNGQGIRPQRSVRKRKPGSMWVIPLYGMTRPVGKAMGLAKQYAGQANVTETELRMGAEDFAFILTGYLPVSSGWAQVTGL